MQVDLNMGSSEDRSLRIPLWLDCDPGTEVTGLYLAIPR